MEVKLKYLINDRAVEVLKSLGENKEIRDIKTVYSIVKILRRADQELKQINSIAVSLMDKTGLKKPDLNASKEEMDTYVDTFYDHQKNIQIQIDALADDIINLEVSPLKGSILIPAGVSAMDLYQIDGLILYDLDFDGEVP